MNTTEEYLPILNEEGIIVGTDTRENAHKYGLIHGHVHVWVPDSEEGKLILQRRRKAPHKLDATVGGHIGFRGFEESQKYIGEHIKTPGHEAACRETEEEAGFKIQPKQLLYIGTICHLPTKAGRNGEIDRTFTPVFLALMRKNHEHLVSPETGTGFISQSIDDILSLIPGDDKYTWHMTLEWYKNIFEKIRSHMRLI